MYKLLHIHHNIVFIDHSRRYVCENIYNEVLFIGVNNEENLAKLKKYGIDFKIIEKSKENINSIVEYANKFHGVVFNDPTEMEIQILLQLNPKIKTFLKLFGAELYMICADKFLSEKTWQLQPKIQPTLINKIKRLYHFFKRKLKILLNKEYSVKLDNQKIIYQRLDAILIMSKYEYDDLNKLFYLPKIIERQFIDQINDINECKVISQKENKIIIGNSGHRWNNHIDVLDIIKNSENKDNIEFHFFFSYGTESFYSQKVKSLAQEIKNTHLIEKFLVKDEFELIYTQASALIINSYRQHAVGNIIAAIKYGCKIYLSKRSSTYHWLLSKGIIISEIDNLKNDIENKNIKLSVEKQQHNIDCFVKAVKDYPVKNFINNVIAVLEEK
jgi:hypothetical protein